MSLQRSFLLFQFPDEYPIRPILPLFMQLWMGACLLFLLRVVDIALFHTARPTTYCWCWLTECWATWATLARPSSRPPASPCQSSLWASATLTSLTWMNWTGTMACWEDPWGSLPKGTLCNLCRSGTLKGSVFCVVWVSTCAVLHLPSIWKDMMVCMVLSRNKSLGGGWGWGWGVVGDRMQGREERERKVCQPVYVSIWILCVRFLVLSLWLPSPPPFFFKNLFGYHLSVITGELTFERVSYSTVFCLSMLISMSVAWFFGLV